MCRRARKGAAFRWRWTRSEAKFRLWLPVARQAAAWRPGRTAVFFKHWPPPARGVLTQTQTLSRVKGGFQYPAFSMLVWFRYEWKPGLSQSRLHFEVYLDAIAKKLVGDPNDAHGGSSILGIQSLGPMAIHTRRGIWSLTA